MFSRKPLGVAFLALAAGANVSPALAGEMEDRIAALEKQIADLKAMVASNQSSIQTTVETLDVQAKEIEEARPIRKGTKFTYGGYVQLDAITRVAGCQRRYRRLSPA